MRGDNKRSRTQGFTLIEVLVVVAIIALLISILLPSLAKARSQACTAACLSNARQHAVAASIFMTVHNGLIPRAGSRTTIHWTQVVLKMMGNKLRTKGNVNLVPVENFEVYQCPERRTANGQTFLDYVVNGLDHRGPVVDDGCEPNPTEGAWREVQGVLKDSLW